MDNVRYLAEVREALPSNWQISTDGNGTWLYATAPDNPTAIQQGWKIHISSPVSPVSSAITTIRETVGMCVKHWSNFKLAGTPEIHRRINSKRSSRSAVNKFMTIYPSHDHPERLTHLINDLNEVLTAQNAPMVFSDLRLGPQVFMRYGAFIGVSVLQPDGTQRIMIQDPDGKVVEDKRSPFFDPPSWITTPPITGKPLEAPSADDDNASINGYVVKEALHFSSTGGVYLADKNDETVVLKEAIPNAMLLDDNQDAVDRLNKEYDMLSHLSETGYTPRPIEIFSYQNHRFLAMEYLDAPTLLQKVPLPFRDALPIATAISEAVAAIHREGVVIGDLSAKNVLLSKNGGVKIIDFEGAYHTESPPETLFATAGFAPGARAKNQKDDIFSLGSVLMTLFVNVNSLFDQAKSPSDVAARFLAAAGMPKALTTLISECLSETSEARPTASEVAARSSTLQHPLTGHREDTRGVDADDMDIDRTFNTLADFVAQTPFPHRKRNGSEGSRLGIASGIAGITLTLDYIREAEGTQSTTVGERFKEGCWQLLEANLNSDLLPPGFANGLAGVAFALHRTTTDATTVYAESIMQRALAHPMLSDPNFPVTLMHGQCGVGATALYFYKHSGAPAFLEGAVACAQRLKDTVDAGALLLFFALADAMRGEGREADADLWSMRGRESLESLADKPSKSGLNAHLVALAGTKLQQDFGDEFLGAFAMDHQWEFSKDFVPDPSLGGLSGVGLAHLHHYETTGETTHLRSAMEVAKAVSCFIYDNGNGPAFPGSAGLFGASGALVFLSRLQEQPLSPTPFFPWEWL